MFWSLRSVGLFISTQRMAKRGQQQLNLRSIIKKNNLKVTDYLYYIILSVHLKKHKCFLGLLKFLLYLNTNKKIQVELMHIVVEGLQGKTA